MSWTDREAAPDARVVVRIRSQRRSIVELSLKFGVDPPDAIPLLIKAHRLGLKPAAELPRRSQCTHIGNYIEALETAPSSSATPA